MQFSRLLANPEATDAFGVALAESLPAKPMVVHLHGELGAGKSSLARALLRGLGVIGAVRSPTYTLVEPYETDSGVVLHLDLYRLGSADELEFLALDEYLGRTRLWLIEWPERGSGALPAADLKLHLTPEDEGRRLEADCGNPSAEDWVRAAGKIAGPS
jgi:tRNA threonylcarbamoyl adenosine modification protein YjeE